jgi:hypothetical protein
VLPKDFHVSDITITIQGDDTTDAATHAEEIRNVETIEVVTSQGAVIRIEGGTGLDTFWYSKNVTDEPWTSFRQGGDGADEESVIGYALPFGPQFLNPRFPNGELGGIRAGDGDKLRLALGTDTNVGMDSRQATIIAHGWTGTPPSKYRTAIIDSYTTVAAESRFIDLPEVGWLSRVVNFATTEWNADTANTELSVASFHVAKERAQRQISWHTVAGGYGTQFVACPNPDAIIGTAPNRTFVSPVTIAEYYTWKLDLGNQGFGWQIGTKEFLEAVGGVAEATRTYPVLWRRWT